MHQTSGSTHGHPGPWCFVLIKRLSVAQRLLFRGQHGLQISKRVESRGRNDVAAIAASLHVFELGMFVFVTVRAEQFPVAAIWRVVVMVAVFVMHFQQLQIGTIKGASTTSTDPGKQF